MDNDGEGVLFSLQPNLVYIRSSLPWSDQEETSVDLSFNDNDGLWTADLYNSFLHQGFFSICWRLERGSLRANIVWTKCDRDGNLCDEREQT